MNIGFKYAGGTFSHLIVLLDNLTVWKPTKIYVDNTVGGGAFKSGLNFFDVLYDQQKQDGNFNLTYFHRKHDDIWTSPHFNEMKEAAKLLRVKDHLLKRRNEIAKDFKNTLGVHIRLTSFNVHHKNDYNQKTFDDYVKRIDEIVKAKNIETLFIASDNDESLKKLKILYPNLIHIDAKRYENEEMSSLDQEFDNINDPLFFENAMLDCLLLASCDYNLGRPSGLNSYALVMSDRIKERFLM